MIVSNFKMIGKNKNVPRETFAVKISRIMSIIEMRREYINRRS